MNISSIPNNNLTNKTSFKGCVVKTKTLNKAMERAQISDLHNFREALKAMKQVKDKVKFSFTELNSKFFIGKEIEGTLQYERLLEPKAVGNYISPSSFGSIDFVKVVDRDAYGNFIDENGKIITDLESVIACGIRKKGFIPVWNDRSGHYKAEVDTRITPKYTAKKESIQHAFKKFARIISANYNVTNNNKNFETREELISAINEQLK